MEQKSLCQTSQNLQENLQENLQKIFSESSGTLQGHPISPPQSPLDIGSVIAPKNIGELSDYKFSEAPSRARRIVKDYDILLSTVRPNLKSFVRVRELNEDVIASTGFAVISPKDRIVGSVLFHAFFSNRFETFCEARVTGTSYPAISARDIRRFKVYLPKQDADLRKTAKAMDITDDAISKIDGNIRDLTSLIKSLTNTLIGPGAAYV